MTTPTEDEARAAALKAYPHRNPYLEGGAYMGEVPLRDAFVEGAMWAAYRVSTPPSERRVQQAQWEDQLRREAPTLTQYEEEET